MFLRKNKKIWLGAALTGCLLGLFFFLSSSTSANLSKTAEKSLSSADLLAGLPQHLTIPRLEIDTAVEQVGLTPDGAMDVPKGTSTVAWFAPGTRPGDLGSAVITGHLDGIRGATAVFDKLDTLQKGDLLSITDGKGTIIHFVVRESRLYDRDAIAPEIFSSESGSHLNLITCAGVWNKALKSYTKRLVVFTDKVEEVNL